MIVVEIRGGCLVRVLSYNVLTHHFQDVPHELIDWDDIKAGDAPPEVAKLLYPDEFKEANHA